MMVCVCRRWETPVSGWSQPAAVMQCEIEPGWGVRVVFL